MKNRKIKTHTDFQSSKAAMQVPHYLSVAKDLPFHKLKSMVTELLAWCIAISLITMLFSFIAKII